MPEFTLPSETVPGLVALTVKDLEPSVDFYQNVLGFHLHHQKGSSAALGAGGTDLLVLNSNPKAQPSRRTTGLYHFAVRVPTRRDLAYVLRRIAETQTQVSGLSDHVVSEAIYLSDPDSNGIEIYRDRPPETWRGADGNIRMGTEPLDVDGLLAELNGEGEAWSGLPPGTRLGHIHLHVADLDPAIRFYRDILGLELMMRYGPSAAFLSTGGYHHHIGINTWNGIGAPQPPKEATGLRYYSLHLPNKASLEMLVQHLIQNGVAYKMKPRGIWLEDPSANRILVVGAPN